MIDVLLDNNLDLAIQNGDFVLEDCEQQNQELILIATKGSFRASPLTGVGIARYIKSSFSIAKVDQLRQNIRLQLQYDGYSSVSTQINSFSDITIKAER